MDKNLLLSIKVGDLVKSSSTATRSAKRSLGLVVERPRAGAIEHGVFVEWIVHPIPNHPQKRQWIVDHFLTVVAR